MKKNTLKGVGLQLLRNKNFKKKNGKNLKGLQLLMNKNEKKP